MNELLAAVLARPVMLTARSRPLALPALEAEAEAEFACRGYLVPARTLANPIARYVLEYPFVLRWGGLAVQVAVPAAEFMVQLEHAPTDPLSSVAAMMLIS